MFGSGDENSLNEFKKKNININIEENQNSSKFSQSVEELNKSFDNFAEEKTKKYISKKFDLESGTEHKEKEIKQLVKVPQNIERQDKTNVKAVANVLLGKNEYDASKEINELLSKVTDQGFKELIVTCKVLLEDKGKINTNTFAEFKEAAEEFDDATGKYIEKQKDTSPLRYNLMVKSMMHLYEAAQGYLLTHTTKNERYKAAESVCQKIDEMLMGNFACAQDEVIKDQSPDALKKAKKAKEVLINLNSNYVNFARELAENPFETPEEKVNRKLSLFNSHQIYFDEFLSGNKSAVPKEIDFLLKERQRLFAQLNFMAVATKNSMKMQKADKSLFDEKNELKKRNEELDKGLTKEQERGVAEIDRWLLRNYNNGGLVGGFRNKVKKNRAEFIFGLLSLSKRERLYIYFMIESRKRVKPDESGDDMIYSQKHYTPDLDNFKDKMIATRWKFSKRFAGDYIYWDKIDKTLSLLDTKKNQEVLNGQYLNKTVQQQDVKENYKAKEESGFFSRKKTKEVRTEIYEAKVKTDYINVMINMAKEIGLVDGNGAIDLSFLEKNGVKLGKSIANSAVSVPVTTLDLFSQIADFIVCGKDLDKPEIVASICDILVAGGKSTQSVLKAISSVSEQVQKTGGVLKTSAEFVSVISDAILSKISLGSSIAGAAGKAVQGGFWSYKSHKATSAVKAIKKKYENEPLDDSNLTYDEKQKKNKEKKYDTRISSLAKKLSDYKGKKLLMGSVTAGLGLLSTAVPFLAIPLSGVSAVYTTITSIKDAMLENNLAKWIFDKYFDIEKLYKETVSKFKIEHPDKYKLMRRLRERVATQNKCASVHSAVSFIGNDYAQYLLKKVFDGNDINAESKKPYIDIIKSYGLKIRTAKGAKDKNRPTLDVLSRKIIGR